MIRLDGQTMYAITGITGLVGGVVAENLLAARQPVRAVVRDSSKGKVWKDRGCEVALATLEDAGSLAAAFQETQGVFVLVPPNFDPQPGFPEARAISAALRRALETARPLRVVYLSTIGAQASQPNLLTQHAIIEKALSDLSMPITFLRPGWFMENCRWDVSAAREQGVIPSFLQPLTKPVPMVATADIGRVAAGLLQKPWSGHRVVELEGPRRVTPDDIAAAFTKLLGRSVRMQIIPRDSWEQLFKSQAMTNPLPRMRMLDGFNEGWIEFEKGEAGSLKGKAELETVLKSLIQQADV
jgi:NAD(P)H dehydrogenase (quinone)